MQYTKPFSNEMHTLLQYFPPTEQKVPIPIITGSPTMATGLIKFYCTYFYCSVLILSHGYVICFSKQMQSLQCVSFM